MAHGLCLRPQKQGSGFVMIKSLTPALLHNRYFKSPNFFPRFSRYLEHLSFFTDLEHTHSLKMFYHVFRKVFLEWIMLSQQGIDPAMHFQ